jgi:phage gp46-like protein
MPSYAADIPIVIDGVESSWLAVTDPLVRAVVISLFTWRRARPDDPHEGTRWGWWADGLVDDGNDRIGSRLWLLAREKLTDRTLVRAREYANEALQWLLDDLVATSIVVTAERRGLDGLALKCEIERDQLTRTTLRFENVWRILYGL